LAEENKIKAGFKDLEAKFKDLEAELKKSKEELELQTWGLN